MPALSRRSVALAQGVYFAATGLWPIVHARSFQAVTGPKVDVWLVKTVGALVGVIGGTLVASALRDRVTPEVAALGAGSAAALGTVDVLYVRRGRIPKVYLADAVAEAALVGAWARAGREG